MTREQLAHFLPAAAWRIEHGMFPMRIHGNVAGFLIGSNDRTDRVFLYRTVAKFSSEDDSIPRTTR